MEAPRSCAGNVFVDEPAVVVFDSKLDNKNNEKEASEAVTRAANEARKILKANADKSIDDTVESPSKMVIQVVTLGSLGIVVEESVENCLKNVVKMVAHKSIDSKTNEKVISTIDKSKPQAAKSKDA